MTCQPSRVYIHTWIITVSVTGFSLLPSFDQASSHVFFRGGDVIPAEPATVVGEHLTAGRASKLSSVPDKETKTRHWSENPTHGTMTVTF